MNEDDFFNEMNESEPMEEWRLREIYEEGLEKSMRFAYSLIEEAGADNWIRGINIADSRKLTIINNMIEWFAAREEYERCAVLVAVANKLK